MANAFSKRGRFNVRRAVQLCASHICACLEFLRLCPDHRTKLAVPVS